LTESDFSTDDENDQEQPARWPIDEASRMRRLEAVLLMARKPLNSRKISQLADLEDGTQARTMIKQLNQNYDKIGRSFHVKRIAGGYQMRTRPQFADWIRRLEHVPKPTSNRLSTPALETLTVVAFRQPIIKADIEAIRGVSSGEMLRQLLEKGLVKIAGRSEQLGRPYLYATSKEFLTEYGLTSLTDLPRAKQLIGTGLPEWATPENGQATESVEEQDADDPEDSETEFSDSEASDDEE